MEHLHQVQKRSALLFVHNSPVPQPFRSAKILSTKTEKRTVTLGPASLSAANRAWLKFGKNFQIAGLFVSVKTCIVNSAARYPQALSCIQGKGFLGGGSTFAFHTNGARVCHDLLRFDKLQSCQFASHFLVS